MNKRPPSPERERMLLDLRAGGKCSTETAERFFPAKGGSTRIAKRLCVGCPLKDPCLEYALAADERFGIWGGLSERERRAVKRERAA